MRSLVQQALDKIKNRDFAISEQDYVKYNVWLSNNRLTENKFAQMRTQSSQFDYRPKISIVLPAYNSDGKWLTAAIDSAVNQTYPNWELCAADDASTNHHVRRILANYSSTDPRIKIKCLDEHLGIAGACNTALSMVSGEYVGFLDHDDELTPDALFEVVRVLNMHPNADLIYSDEDKLDSKERRGDPFFKPDWSPDLLLTMNYFGHFIVIRTQLLMKIGGFRHGFEGSQDYDLILRLTDLTNRIFHVNKQLYNWRKTPGSAATSTSSKAYAYPAAKRAISEALKRRGEQADVEDGAYTGHYRVRYRIGSPLVSIIIATKNRSDLLRRCLTSIESRSTYRNYEIIIVDNDSDEEETANYLRHLGTRPGYSILKVNGRFEYSRIINEAAKNARGSHLLLLNNDTEVIANDWIEAMLEHSQRESVAAVGAKLIFPNGKIQHAGVIVGLGGLAGHAFYNLPTNRIGYFGLANAIRNCSAVTAACMMIKRDIFQTLNGFDEKFIVEFGDVDFCLRAMQRGYRNVYTPYAILKHRESASRGAHPHRKDRKFFSERWERVLLEGDPYYNLNLSLQSSYKIATQTNSAIRIYQLLELYKYRTDLQERFPEVRSGNHERLVNWAQDRSETSNINRTSCESTSASEQR